MERLADDIVENPIMMNDDCTGDMPEGSGLGITVSEEKAKKHRVADIQLWTDSAT